MSEIPIYLVVDLFNVDRRTIRDSYHSALSELYLLTATTEYDNARPRSVHLYFRDTGLITAFTDAEASTALRDSVGTFDYTIYHIGVS